MSIATKRERKSNVSINVKERIAPPRLWKVIMWNDDVTTFQFVIMVLTKIFNYSFNEANVMAYKIDQEGKGVVGKYIKSIAEAKRDTALTLAQDAGFPFKVTIEREDD